MGSWFSDFPKVLLGSLFGVPQGSVLGPLLFNIDMINLFYECEDSNVASYADDTTLYSCATDITSVALEVQASAINFSVGLKITTSKLIQENPIFYLVPMNLRLFQFMEILMLEVPTKNY